MPRGIDILFCCPIINVLQSNCCRKYQLHYLCELQANMYRALRIKVFLLRERCNMMDP